MIKRPTLLLNQTKCLDNIDRMIAIARKYGLRLRPHFKTHQSAVIGSWFQSRGIDSITVSSVSMASYFVEQGWSDITIAFPFNPREWDEIRALNASCKINITLTSPSSVPALCKIADVPLNVFLKIDVGTHRTGFTFESAQDLIPYINKLEGHQWLHFAGLLFHSGHTYQCRSKKEVVDLHYGILSNLRLPVAQLKRAYPHMMVSAGDTPSCSLAQDWKAIDEIRPGNFVFYDLMQWQIGSCSLDDIAVALACPVVAKHEERQSIVLYGGAVHLSKDRMIWRDKTIYGLPVQLEDTGWRAPDLESYVSSISQEHGVIQASKEFYDRFEVGDVIGILPVHSCLTSDLMRSYQLLDTQDTIQMIGRS